MTIELFKNIIAYYGEDNILGFGFDNSAGVTFDEHGKFSLAQHFNETLESLTFVGFDSKGNPFHIIKHIDNIQAIFVRDSGVPFGDYDRITIRG